MSLNSLNSVRGPLSAGRPVVVLMYWILTVPEGLDVPGARCGALTAPRSSTGTSTERRAGRATAHFARERRVECIFGEDDEGHLLCGQPVRGQKVGVHLARFGVARRGDDRLDAVRQLLVPICAAAQPRAERQRRIGPGQLVGCEASGALRVSRAEPVIGSTRAATHTRRRG